MNETMQQRTVIAIDGPAGSGKSTIAKIVAKDLGYRHLDSGSLYRYITYKVMEQGISFEDEPAVAALVPALDYSAIPDEKIRTVEVSGKVSLIAKMPSVRQNLMSVQRNYAPEENIVADGRDMGTTVFHDAPVKIFLTASIEARAKRRFNELKEKGYEGRLVDIEQEITRRDRIDSERAASPLKVASDAVMLDTSTLSIPEVVREVKRITKEILDKKRGTGNETQV